LVKVFAIGVLSFIGHPIGLETGDEELLPTLISKDNAVPNCMLGCAFVQ
jgi:hypothetical protein